MRATPSRTFALLLLLAAACDDYDPNAVLRQNAPAPPPSVQPGAVASQSAAKAEPVEGERAYRDSDFAESEQNRDPFRSFATELKAKQPVVAQRMVLMPETPVEEMRLIAIITGIDQPKAMIVDGRGVGYVTTRGDFVGKADVIQGGGADALPVALNWRIDRIREAEVVLAREDPSAPNRPPLTKVIPLHDESAAAPKG